MGHSPGGRSRVKARLPSCLEHQQKNAFLPENLAETLWCHWGVRVHPGTFLSFLALSDHEAYGSQTQETALGLAPRPDLHF